MMKYYLDKITGGVFAYEADGSQDDFIDHNKVAMSDDEVRSALNPPPSNAYLSNFENRWRESEIAAINDQLMAIEEYEAGVDGAKPMPGSRIEWLNYRSKVRAWNDGAKGFPENKNRPVRP